MPTMLSASLSILKATLATRPLPTLSAAVSITGITAGLLLVALWSLTGGVTPTHGLAVDPDATEAPHPTAPNRHQVQLPPPPDDGIQSSSTIASAVVELQLTVGSMPMDAVSGSSIELYLEDDFRVLDAIAADAVHFTVSNPFTADTNNGAPVRAAGSIEIRQGAHYRSFGNRDWSIRVFLPDMSDAANSGFNGPRMGQTVNLVFTEAAGIRNPSEEGTHSVGYSLLGPSDQPNQGPQVELGTLPTYAAISLSDTASSRAGELTVTGSGFNNGTAAAVYLLTREPAQGGECADIIRNGSRVGIGIVGSDDKVVVTVEVAVPPFVRGDQNYLCMVDGEGRMSRNVEQYHLQAYLRVEPAEVSAGDTVTVFAHDFPNVGATFSELRVAGQVLWSTNSLVRTVDVSHSPIGPDGSATASFVMPGSIHGVTLQGTVRVDAKWGDVTGNGILVVTGNTSSVSNVAVCSGANPGEVVVSWHGTFDATYYRIGYVNMVQDYPRAKASVTGEWSEAFIYVDVNARNIRLGRDGREEYTLRRLVPGDRHAFTVLASSDVVNTRETISGTYAWPLNPRWQFLTVADPGTHCEGVAAQPTGDDADRDALIAIYHSLNGSNWRIRDNWLSDRPLYTWYGVIGDEANRVFDLDLRGNSLHGEIPVEMANLASLGLLELSTNSLFGDIPPELGNLDYTWYHLGSGSSTRLIRANPAGAGQPGCSPLPGSRTANQLTGNIPPELGNLTELEGLLLSNNQLTGQIPPELGNLPRLQRLELSGNPLTGCIPDTLRSFGDHGLGLPFC